jgi:hypothetical protein
MDSQYIKTLIQNILNKSFSDPDRRHINTYDNRFNFCCPVCGDSTRSVHKKRGNLFFNSLFFECFNCGHKSSLNALCKYFSIQLDPSKRLEMIEYLNNAIEHSNYEQDINEVNFGDLIELSDLERIFNSGEIILTDFTPITKGSLVHNYLLERGIHDKLQHDIYQAKNWLNEDRYEWVMIFINRKGNKVLGMQTRNLKSGRYRSFKIYNFEHLYRWVHKINTEDEIEGVDLNQLLIFNKLSYFFNILNIDFGNTITIFEGYLDSLFYPNSVGVVGVNTNMSILESNNLDIQYFYDNDEAGFSKSDEKIKSGFKVFLWNKMFEDIVERKKSEDPYTLMHRISQVKDLNKLSQLVPNPYAKLELINYFSKDIYDIKWIPRKEKKKWFKNESNKFNKTTTRTNR